jgi:hypothetical protein
MDVLLLTIENPFTRLDGEEKSRARRKTGTSGAGIGHVRSLPKTICLNSISAASLFSARMRSNAPSQLFSMNRARRAGDN